jgi:hypothetical protein
MQQQPFGAALLIGVALTGGALAADVPGNATTKAVLQLGLNYRTGLIDRPNDADWYRVQLVKGRHYAFQVSMAEPLPPRYCEGGLGYVTLVLADAKGRVLALTSSGCDGGTVDGGFELTATRSGVHFARVSGPVREGYEFRAAVDAVNDTSTKAVLLVDKPVNGTLLFGHDVDYFRIHLVAGKSYALKLEQTGRCDLPSVILRDKADNFIFEEYIEEVFSVGTTDDYFVEVSDADSEYECSYRVRVTD